MRSLKSKTIHSIKWTTLQTGIVAGIGPIIHILLAAFLIPGEIAGIAVIMIILGLFNTFESFGISHAVIQKDKITGIEASSLFYFNILFTALFGIMVYLSSPLIARFFSIPELERFIRLTCVVIVVAGPSILFRGLMQKNMLFKELAIIEIIKHSVLLVGITVLMVSGYGVWGFVFSHIVATALATAMVTVTALKMKLTDISLRFNIKKILPLLRFGFLVSGKQLLTFASHRIDEILIGYFLSPAVLGVYYFGKHMLEKIRILITNSFGQVMFPVFSKLKNDSKKLSDSYLTVTRLISFIAFPVFVGLSVTAHLFVPVLFGEKWLGSIVVFQIYSLALLCMIVTANLATSVLYALNRPATVFTVDAIGIALYFSVLMITAADGIMAVLMTYSLFILVKTAVLQYIANKSLAHSFSSYLVTLTPSLYISLIMAAGVLAFQHIAKFHFSDAIILAGSVLAGIVLCVVSGLIFQRRTMNEILNNLASRRT